MRSIFKFLLMAILIIVIAVAAGSWYFLRTFDLNHYKDTIEQQVYNYTGRRLKINGDARLGVSLIPTLVVDDVTFANASWAEQPDMVKLQKLKVQIAILPLLKKNVVINDITLIQPQIYLEKNANGMNNWTFSKGASAALHRQTLAFAQMDVAKEVTTTSAYGTPLPAFIQNITLKNISIEDGTVIYNDNGKKQEAVIKSLTLSMDSLDSPINIDVDAVYQNQPIAANMVLGTFNQLFNEETAFPVDISAKAFNVKAAVNGALFSPLKDLAFDVNANIYTPAGNFGLPETTLIAGLKGTPQIINADIQTLNVANNLITGTIKADISQKIPHINAALKSNQIDLRTLQKGEPLAMDFNLIAPADAAEYVPNTPIPYELLSQVNGNFKIVIGQLIVDDAFSASNVDLIASIKNGILDIKPLKLNFGNGEVDLNAVLNAQNKSLTLKLNSKDILLQDFHKEFIIDGKNDFGVISGGKTMMSADLTTQGKTYRQMVQNLRGQTVVIVSDSQFQTGGLKFVATDFISQLLKVLNIDTNKSSKLDMQCAVIRTDIGNGKADFPNGIAIQSDKMTVAGNGDVNLLNDKINFSLVPAFNMDAGITQALSSLIKIQGTVQQPKIGLDNKQALQTVVGIATTGGAGYLGAQAMMSDNSPCYTALKGTAYQSFVPQPSAASQAQQKTIQGAKDAYNDSKAAVKKELKNIEKNAKDFINMFKGKK